MTIDPRVLEKIKSEIVGLGRDTRYAIEAYSFVLQGLEFYMAGLGERRHVTGQDLSRGLAEYAISQYGLFAKRVLGRWGISVTDDFGYIVYNLIDIGVMSRQPTDRVEDFFQVFDLSEFFEKRDFYLVDKDYIRGLRSK
jgi:uncharacterized repeat protein (TIGR04138 family)